MPGKKGYRKFKGCDEDCFNCKYPDCYKPVVKLKSMREIKKETKREGYIWG